MVLVLAQLTNCDRLDPDAFFEMRIGSIIGLFLTKDTFAAECVHEGGSACKIELLISQDIALPTCTTSTTYHHRELNTFLDIFLLTDLGLVHHVELVDRVIAGMW